MSQSPKFIDLTRSYLPVDPKSFPENLHATNKEDYPEDAVPVVAYAGHNFLPTSYGYKSYFGVDTQLAVDAIPGNVDKILLFQTADLENILVALCDNGIWTKLAETPGAWDQSVVLEPLEDTILEWTYTVLENVLYMYRATESVYWTMHTYAAQALVDAIPAETPITSVVAEASAGAVPVGTYEYAVARYNADGWLSAPSAWVSIVVAAASAIVIKFPDHVDAVRYRIYRRNSAGVVSYLDYLPVVSTYEPGVQTVYDVNQFVAATVVLPDNTWLTNAGITYWKPRDVVPSFLLMEGQQGIFRAGGRLGFWDSSNSIAWSSIDDFAEFTPSLQTLAGSAIFNEIIGRIVTIRGHGKGFMIYSTKSVVYITYAPQETFQWRSNLIASTGIAYANQVAEAVPDTTHFAWTDMGVLKIVEGREEWVIPEVYDYLKSALTPIYLQIIQGRFLFVSVYEEEYLLGNEQARTMAIPPSQFTFPQGLVISDLGDPVNLEGHEVCYAVNGWEEIMTTSGASSVASGGFTFDDLWMSYYTAHLSRGTFPGTVTWTTSPCPVSDINGLPLAMAPVEGRTADYVDAGFGTTPITYGPADWPYRWDTEKFVALQLALWAMDDARREAYIDQLRTKVYVGSKLVPEHSLNVTVGSGPGGGGWIYGYLEDPPPSCASVPLQAPTFSLCTLGKYILTMSPPSWGMDNCSLWLTRYAIQQVELTLVGEQRFTCDIIPDFAATYWYAGAVTGATPLEVVEQLRINAGVIYTQIKFVLSANGKDGAGYYYHTASFVWVLIGNIYQFIPFRRDVTNHLSYRIAFGEIENGIFAVQQARLELAGWYRRKADDSGFDTVPKGTTCAWPSTIPPAELPPPEQFNNLPIDQENGTFCSTPFAPITLPGISAEPITWPEQIVNLPGASFLLRSGSRAPLYDSLVAGAYVYDLHLKKWGKMVQTHRLLMDYTPVNSQAGAIIPFATFGIQGGILDYAKKIAVFTDVPLTSQIKYGKMGYYRKGLTNAEELVVHFKTPSTGYAKLEGSLDRRTVDAALVKSVHYADSLTAQLGANMSASWYNIIVDGRFDLTHLEFRGLPAGRR